MSFSSNIGKPYVEPTATQCEMVKPHHMDCECASCKLRLDVQCLERSVGTVPENGDCRVCVVCAQAMEGEGWGVTYYDATA